MFGMFIFFFFFYGKVEGGGGGGGGGGKVRELVMTVKCVFNKSSFNHQHSLLTKLADEKMVTFLLFFPGISVWHFTNSLQYKMSNPFFSENKKNITKCNLIKFIQHAKC